MDLQLGLSLGGVSSSLSSLLASILYQTNLGDFVYRTDDNGNMILDNQGNEGSLYDGLTYSGRGIELGALNDVTVGDAAKWTTYFDFSTATHVKTFGVQVLNTKTINSILVSANEPSAETLSVFNANPNLVGKLAKSVTGTIPEVDLTLVASDSYYMCSEKSGAYLVDSRVAYGAEIHDDPSFDTPANWTVSNATVSGGQVSMTVTAGAMSYAYNTNSNLVVGKYYMIEFDVASFTGVGVFGMCSGAGNNLTNYIGFSSSGIHSGIFYAYSDSILGLGIKRYTTSGDYSCVVNSYSIREATATEIANYASTVRTNADIQQKGIQTTAFVTDGAGVPTAYSSDLLQFNGDGRYVNTKWIPSVNDWSFEFVVDIQANGIQEIFGTTSPQFRFRKFTNTTTFFYMFGTTLTTTNPTGLTHFVAVNNTATGRVHIYQNGVAVSSELVTPTVGTLPVYIGAENGSTNVMYSAMGLPEANIGKALSATEVATVYAQAKAIYTTLP